ncbi:MAG: hypothetical protein HYS21_13680 [Deltaproteobacteria bacterium]|nr:hypothetical protein [Deltaproteobacteria bacterium]
MAERSIDIVIRARDEFSEPMSSAQRKAYEAAEKIKEGFEGVTAAQKEAETSTGKMNGNYRDLENSAGSVKGGFSELTQAMGENLSKAEKLDAGYSKLFDNYISGAAKASSAGAVLAAPLQAGSGAESSATGQYQLSSDLLPQYLNQYREFLRSLNAMEYEHSVGQKTLYKETWDYKLSLAGTAAGSLSNTLQNLFVATGSKNKAMFDAMKSFAIAETVIQTYRGAMGAYAAMASIPYVGPALGIAAAAAVVTAGMAKLQAIRQTQPDGATGTISESGTANPSYSGGSTTAYPVPQRIEDAMSTQYITVQIYNPLSEQNWQKIVEDNIIPALKDAGDRNISVNVRNM